MTEATDSRPATINLWPEAAKILGLKKDAAYRAAQSGDIPALKIGRLWRVPRVALERMLENPPRPKVA